MRCWRKRLPLAGVPEGERANEAQRDGFDDVHA